MLSKIKQQSGCSLVVRIPRCGRGDLGSNPSSHILLCSFAPTFNAPSYACACYTQIHRSPLRCCVAVCASFNIFFICAGDCAINQFVVDQNGDLEVSCQASCAISFHSPLISKHGRNSSYSCQHHCPSISFM